MEEQKTKKNKLLSNPVTKITSVITILAFLGVSNISELKRIVTAYYQGESSVEKPEIIGDPIKVESTKVANPEPATNKISDPAKKIVKSPARNAYFNNDEKLNLEVSTSLLIKKDNSSANDFQQLLSDGLLMAGIDNSTTMLTFSLTNYSKYRSADKTWLNNIKLGGNVASYIVGELKENESTSSANKKIVVLELAFTGRIVSLNPIRVHPISFKQKGSSFNKTDARDEAYQELVNKIVQSTKVIL